MAILRILAVLILVAACGQVAIAQSSLPHPSTATDAAPPHLPALQFGPGEVSPALGTVGAQPFHAPSHLDLFSPPKQFVTIHAFREGVVSARLAELRGRLKAILPNRNSTCYAMRSYDFANDEPGSDATRLSGSSTCRPALQAKLKAVADPRESLQR